MAAEEKLDPSRLLVPSVEPTTSDASEWPSGTSSPVRGRKRRRRSALSPSPTRSPSPSRGHERSSASRHREERRSRLGLLAASEASDSSAGHLAGPTSGRKSPPKRLRRRSDLDPDHTFRGRARHRSPKSEDAIAESTSDDDASGSQEGNYTTKTVGKKRRGVMRRSSPPSRSSRPTGDHGPDSPVLRRRRSLPNQYHGLTPNRDTAVMADDKLTTG